MQPAPDQIFKAVQVVHRRCSGGYASIALFPGHGMLAIRDPNGIRPIVFGSRQTSAGKEYAIASESVALDVLGFELERDLAPGEALFISLEGEVKIQQCALDPKHRPCIFEFVYFARPDSMIDDISVYKSRLRMG